MSNESTFLMGAAFIGLLAIVSYLHNLRWGLILFVTILVIGIVKGGLTLDPIMSLILFASIFLIVMWDYLVNIPSFSNILKQIENFSLNLIPSIDDTELILMGDTEKDKYYKEKALNILHERYAREGEYYIVGSNHVNQILEAFDPDYLKQFIGSKSYHLVVTPNPIAFYYVLKEPTYAEYGTHIINKSEYLQIIDLPDGTKVGIMLPATLYEGYISDDQYHQTTQLWVTEGLTRIADLYDWLI